MKRILFFILTAAMSAALFTAVFGGDYETGGVYTDAEAAGRKPVAIEGTDGYYIMADSDTERVYITDERGTRLIDDGFLCVCSKADEYGCIKVRYSFIDDWSGFAVLNSRLETIIHPDNYYFITDDSDITGDFSGGQAYTAVKRNDEGELVSYRFVCSSDGDIVYHSGIPEELSSYSEEKAEDLKAADEAGIIPASLKFRDFTDGITRQELAELCVQAILKTYDTDFESYYDSVYSFGLEADVFLDTASPDVIFAAKKNIISYPEGKYFYPDQKATREEVAAALWQTARTCRADINTVLTYKEDFSDEDDIDDLYVNAAYQMSVTYSSGGYVMPGTEDNMFLPKEEYSIEDAVISVWRACGSKKADIPDIYRAKKSIGCGIWLVKNDEGKWGAVTSDGTVIVEPAYELAAEETLAFNGIFTLSDSGNVFNGRENTYYVFDSEGNLIKTLKYGSDEMKADGQIFCDVYAAYASGSNLVFSQNVINTMWDDYSGMGSFIKRLVSEKVSAEDFYFIYAKNDGIFSATERSSGRKCILKPDGSFMRYADN